jgi:hypothetical protein
MPMNIVIASVAMATSVAAALRLSGGLNAGTPFDTASTPVIAVQPFENAVSSANAVSMPPAWVSRTTPPATGIAPLKYRHAPTASIARMLTMKKYVGTAKMRPDSRTPRRLPIIRSATNPIDSSTR